MKYIPIINATPANNTTESPDNLFTRPTHGLPSPAEKHKLTIQTKNLALNIPLQHDAVRVVEVSKGSKLMLSSVCLDILSLYFQQIKLMVRCIELNPEESETFKSDFICLCNYLGAAGGGAGLALVIVGPSKIEFRLDIRSKNDVSGGGVNIFGVVISADTFIQNSMLSPPDASHLEISKRDNTELVSRQDMKIDQHHQVTKMTPATSGNVARQPGRALLKILRNEQKTTLSKKEYKQLVNKIKDKLKKGDPLDSDEEEFAIEKELF